MTPETKESKKIDHVNNMEVPADANAEKDHFWDFDRQDSLRQKLGSELRQAPWNKGTSEQPLTKVKTLTKTVKPAHEEFWDNQERDIFIRLNEAAKKLEVSQTEAKKDAALQNSQVEDQVSQTAGYVSSHQPVGHHLLKCSRDTLQKELTEAVHEVPVEPLKAPPKVVHPFPRDTTKFQLMPPPNVPVKFSVRLNKVAKMKTGPPSPKTKMLAAITITPHVTICKLSSEELRVSHHHFRPPHTEAEKEHLQQQAEKQRTLSS